MSTTPVQQRGYLMPIGGAEDRIEQRTILAQFVKLAGGSQAHIKVIPSASAFSHELGPEYVRIFTELGAGNAEFADVQERDQANDPDCVAMFHNATGIFFSGGDQLKLVALLGGTLLLQTMKARFEQGATVAGTSAGASAMSEHMISFGRSGPSPSMRMVAMGRGLGFTDKCVLDQHFRERDRIGRLVSAVTQNPEMLGVGIDEDTAFVIAPDDTCEVIGRGSVSIVDGGHINYTDMYDVTRYNEFSVFGVRMHFLTREHGFDLKTRTPIAPKRQRGT